MLQFSLPSYTGYLYSVIALRRKIFETSKAMASFSKTRWSKWEIMQQVMVQFGDIHPFLMKHTEIGPSLRGKLLIF